ncbi:alginate lyase [Tsuneonella flava]|uniref:Alginate lyase n=1 Tax=Tsuneonella flava TaxID=2055955 RepID=A0ABX7KE47_9SPHN|nr:polysaccharide lyase 6 family protein [Tsuneonella flava]QSB45852.1 alginate lyase [Tsuneonella flava]
MLRICLLSAVALLYAVPVQAENYYVRSQGEYAKALESVKAGDIIILANGEWRDFDLVVTGRGRKDAPITVISEEAGKVILTGQSSLRIGGEYVLVTGLVFKDGYSPRGEVISFRRTKEDQARYSRVTEVVIDGFSKPGRYDVDYWVGLYGSSNRFDHSYLAGKTNKGVTLVVRLDTEGSRENSHRIDHNYFGPRPVLGSNGGETLRIGTSRYSMFNSNTLVENNIFDRCDGEVEIISSKSGGNIFRGNVFLRSRGSLTLRHGDDNLVERNVFFGGGKDYTGGIRVINRGQVVRNNYLEGLRGTGFSSALSLMNGVPNSPVNRYVQVERAAITNNTVIDSTRVTLGAGEDEERSAPPIDSLFARNLLSAKDSASFLAVDTDISGIAMADNLFVGGEGRSEIPGIKRANVQMVRAENGLLYPADPSLLQVGAPRDLSPVALNQVGPRWYAKPSPDPGFGASGKVIEVTNEEGALVKAASAAGVGDVLMLAPGDHVVSQVIALDKALTFRGAAADEGRDSIVRFTGPALIELREGGAIQLEDMVIDGGLAPNSAGNSVIRTPTSLLQSNIRVDMDNVTVRDLDASEAFNVLTLGAGVLAEQVAISNSAFANISGTVVSAASEFDDDGKYNLEYLEIANSSFAKVQGNIADVYRGGRDESTFGPSVKIAGNVLSEVGRGRADGEAWSLRLHGVQTARIERNSFASSAPLLIEHTSGTPVTEVIGNQYSATPAPVYKELVYEGKLRVRDRDNVFDKVPAK